MRVTPDMVLLILKMERGLILQLYGTVLINPVLDQR